MAVQKTFNKNYLIAAASAIVTLLVYLPALWNEFVYWDDNLYVFENPHIRSLDGSFFRWAFSSFDASNWHPLTWISHAVDYAIWGMNPLGHHLTSIILHAVNTGLVVLLALQLLQIAKERGSRDHSPSFLNDRAILIAAGVTGLLFGIHPVHVESVAWVSERKDLLCALFFLLSIMAYVKAAEGRGAEGKRLPVRVLLPALGFFVLALLSKPMAVTLPVVLLILDWYPLGRIGTFRTFRTALVEKVPFFALSLASSIVTVAAQQRGGALTSIEKIPLLTRILVAAQSLLAYLGKMLLPMNLIPFYPYPREVTLFSLVYPSSILLTIAITAGCVMQAKRQKIWLSAWGYYVVTLLPVLGIVQVGGQAMADRYTYLPSLGPFLVAGLCSAWVSDNILRGRKPSLVNSTAFVLGVPLLIITTLSSLTIRQITLWRDSVRLWTSVIEREREPLPMAYVNRGAALQKSGLFDNAIADYKTAIALDPTAFRAYISLGTAYEHMGMLDKAMENDNKAIALNPSSQEAFRNRGILFERMQKFDRAIADYTHAIDLKPNYYEAYNNRGLTYAKMGHLDEAIADYNETILINPHHFGAWLNRGVAYTLAGQYDLALRNFNRAIELGQDDAVAYFNRGMFYRRTGKRDLAIADLRKSCELGNERACDVNKKE
jgi:tetratricopeptide (TPR) repeat protein